MPSAAYPNEIVVVGPRITDGLYFLLDAFFWNVWQNLEPGLERSAEWLAQPYATLIDDHTNPDHAKRQLIDNVILQFLNAYEALKTVIESLSDTEIIRISDMESLTGAELKAKFLSLQQVVVTEQNYPDGYGGRNYNTYFEIDWHHLASFMLRGQNGGFFLLLHELGHNTKTGLSAHDRNWNRNLSDGGTEETYQGSNIYFRDQESIANTIARNVADAIGVSITSPLSGDSSWPTYGFKVGEGL